MANLLEIIKESGGYFTFILNSDVANSIRNKRNDLLTIGNIAHFKTANGANLVKEQNIVYSDVTITDGGTSIIPTSISDLFFELENVGYFDWIVASGGGSGVNRYESLTDTIPFFGNNGKVPVVNESDLRLDYIDLPDVTKLNQLPNVIVPNKILKSNNTGTAYEFASSSYPITQEIRQGVTDTAPSENRIFNEFSLKEKLENKTGTITGNEASIDLYANIKGLVDWLTATKIKSILGITTLSGSNTGDETKSTLNSKLDYELERACSDEDSNLSVKTVITFRMPCDMLLSEARISLNNAPTLSSLIVDVKQAGVSIFSTLLSIDASETTSVTAAVPAVISTPNLTDNSIITVSITQVGTGDAGKGLKILFKGKRV